MPTAYVLLNTEIGAENQVLRALKELDGVEEAYKLWGVYDIIANIAAEDMDELKHIITNRIDEIGKINSKLTMIVSDKVPVMFPIQKAEEKHGIIEYEPVPVLA
ncbi:MAG: Lrp/AsnC ligand binding domain-containing protein [Candidatus Bathyarchaeota archaeon]|nr:Lrp/AsnC ligand binding domain-containing protein [Candidatus Bathyarchaeota archaeon]